jgi:hypothetical protein
MSILQLKPPKVSNPTRGSCNLTCSNGIALLALFLSVLFVDAKKSRVAIIVLAQKMLVLGSYNGFWCGEHVAFIEA